MSTEHPPRGAAARIHRTSAAPIHGTPVTRPYRTPVTRPYRTPVARPYRRSLPAPPAHWGPLGAFAWRSSLYLYRRSLWSQLGLLGWLIALATAPVLFDGLFGLAWQALALSQVLARLIGPDVSLLPHPATPYERTLGTVLPGALLAMVGLILAQGFTAPSPAQAFSLAIQPVLGLVLLHKLSLWLETSHERFEVLAGAALLTLSADLIMRGLGLAPLVPALTLFLGLFIAALPERH
jgi:hypothetical protein